MAILNPSNYTFSKKQVYDISEAIREEFHEVPAITLFHTVEEGIKANKQIAILGKLGQIGKKQGSDCAPTASGQKIGVSEKIWKPEPIEDRFVECWKNLTDTFFIWATKNGINKADLTGTDFAIFLEENVGALIMEAALRISWFGDTNAATTDASPAGNVTEGADAALFTPIDGFWKQLFAIATADTSRRVEIARNTEVTYAAQDFTATDTTNKVATGIFRDLLTKADSRLKGDAQKVIIATESLVEQYLNELEAQGQEPAFDIITDGMTSIKRRGTVIYGFNFQDRIIREFFDDGSKYHLPHRAVLITPDNLRIGTEEAGNIGQLEPFYDQKDKQYYVDFLFNLDAKIILDYKVQVAY